MRFIWLFILLVSSSAVSAQELSLEIAGSGGLGSINYSKSFKAFENLQLDYRLGITAAPIDRNNGTAIGFPLLIHGIFGSGKHKLDAAIGQGISITTAGSFFVTGLASIGYRYQTSGKLYYRFSYTPFIPYIVDRQYIHWGGITIGYNIQK